MIILYIRFETYTDAPSSHHGNGCDLTVRRVGERIAERAERGKECSEIRRETEVCGKCAPLDCSSDHVCFQVGAISGEQVENRWTPGQQREMSKASMLALVAAEEALSEADAVGLDHEETSVNIGTCMSDLEHIGETAQKVTDGLIRRVSPYFVPRILNNLPAGYVAMKYASLRIINSNIAFETFRYKMRGGVESTSTACATGLHCIGNAFRSIRYGDTRRAVAGAVECALNPISLAGFDRMRALARGDQPSISRPFDKKRSGFVMGEGVGLVFLERLEDAKARGARILAEVIGYGISSDCYHISTPDPSAIGAVLSMRRAIRDARNLEPRDIG